MKPEDEKWDEEKLDDESGKSCASETTALLNSPRYGHPALFRRTGYLGRLERHFGWQLLFLLFVVQHLMKGLAHRMTMKAIPYVFKAFAIDAPHAQVLNGLIKLPWAVKPMIGLTSDVLPVMGFRKGPYMAISAFSGFCAFAFIITSPQTSIIVAVVCIMLIILQFSTCDILSEAQYASKIQEAPQAGPDLLCYVWAGINIFGILAMLCSGPILQSYGYKAAFTFAAVPASLVLVPVTMGCLQEKRLSAEELTSIRHNHFEKRELCFLCLMMFAGAVVIMFVGLLQNDPRVNFAVAFTVSMFLLFCSSICLTPVVAKANAFAVLYTGLNASISGATFYFYTDSKEVYPAGPHFSDFFFNTVLGTAGSVFALMGLWFYQQYLSGLTYRNLIIFTAMMMFVFSWLDVMMFARINVKLGIPDHWLVLGLSICEQMISEWQWMPQVVLLAALCPPGMEATMLALLAGCHNLGGTVGSHFGAMLLHFWDVKPRGQQGDAAQFDNLWIVAATTSILPLFTAMFFRYLLPDCKQNETRFKRVGWFSRQIRKIKAEA